MSSPDCGPPKHCYKRYRDPSSSSTRASDTTSKMTVSNFPPLPLITGDLILETFSHKSLDLGYDPDMSTDNQRLIELGRTLLEFAVTHYLYSKRPIVVAAEIPALRNEILSAEKYEAWVTHYNLLPRLRYVPSDSADITGSEEIKQLFQAYVGAVVAQSGPKVATEWITQLIDPEAPIPASPDEHKENEEPRTSKRPRVEPVPPETTLPPLPADPTPAVTHVPSNIAPNPIIHDGAQTPNAAPNVTPEIGPQAFPNKTTSAPKGPGYLLAFNQRCSQRHLQVEYHATNLASPHAPLWVTKCLVNGIQKGEGQGSSKQAAKEAAAKQAYHALGWTTELNSR